MGHTFGPDHPVMATKMNQMNSVLGDIIKLIDNDTILFIMGDHGMTQDGNHGVLLVNNY